MCCPSCSPLNQDVGSNFDKIAEIIQTRNKSQVRTFYNTEVKRINTVLAPLGVQVDPSDDEEVHRQGYLLLTGLCKDCSEQDVPIHVHGGTARLPRSAENRGSQTVIGNTVEQLGEFGN